MSNGKEHKNHMALDFIKYIGPGFLVTVGFIDPGNWASNVSAGSNFGYALLWVVTVSTIMLIILQHTAAHLGIVTGYCLSEASTNYLKPLASRIILITAMIASVSTALAELMGGAIALNMLFKLPIQLGTVIIAIFAVYMLYSNSYRYLEKWIIGFVSIIGLSFIIELSLVHVKWGQAALGWVNPSFPANSIPIIMSILGAVVMPHNLFLHSEVIQSRQWHLEDEKIIKKQLNYEFLDTFFSMIIGWAINSAMIIMAAAAFFNKGVVVTDLSQAYDVLKPLMGSGASVIFALALLFSGVSSSITAGMAGGSIYAGIFNKAYDIHEKHTKTGVGITLIVAACLIFLIKDTFKALIYSQMLLSVQLPVTIFLLIALTSSKKIMGKYANTPLSKIVLWGIGIFVTVLNIILLFSYI